MGKTIGSIIRIKGLTRNKIVFCRDIVDGLTITDVGHELATRIRGLSSAPEYASACKCIFKQVFQSERFGPYLAIKNLGILFEPELRLELHLIIESHSINKLLFIQKEGDIIDGRFCFMGDRNNSIDLQNMSFIEI